MSWLVITEEGKRRRVPAVRNGKRAWVGWPGAAKEFGKQNAFAGKSKADDAIVAPMTGKVLDVAVRVGDQVAHGDVLLVLEAMKMEYRLTAPHDGQIEKISCAEGELVDMGVVLVKIHKEPGA